MKIGRNFLVATDFLLCITENSKNRFLRDAAPL